MERCDTDATSEGSVGVRLARRVHDVRFPELLPDRRRFSLRQVCVPTCRSGLRTERQQWVDCARCYTQELRLPPARRSTTFQSLVSGGAALSTANAPLPASTATASMTAKLNGEVYEVPLSAIECG